MKIYFAGVNQTHFCEAFRGHHVLETFTDSRPLYGRYRATFETMALDCGAYTELRSGKPIDVNEYADFCLEHGEFYEWVASVDSISGGVEQNMRNWEALRDLGIESMPTFHQGEPLSVLDDYCDSAAIVGLGFQRPIKNELAFLDDAFAHIPSTVKVHGWAMTNYTARYPFASVDSTSWLWELKALRAVQTTQHGEPLSHLTDCELIEIIQKRYQRLPRMKQWQRRPWAAQADLFKEMA